MLIEDPLAERVKALRAGRVTPSGYAAEVRERFERVEPEVRAFVEEPDRWERVQHHAGEVEAAYPAAADRPGLFGVPVGVKDIFHVEGLPTRAGSQVPPEVFAGGEAAVVRRFREAGAVVVGKTVTTEFAYTEPGPTRNPHDLEHTPGGSSSGSAAAVAAGLCPLAVGSQTVGSTIRPAAFCGVVGYKPSYGRIPIAGVLPLAPSVDHVGLFAQDVRGMRVAAAVACDGWRAVPAPSGEPVVGVPDPGYVEQASEEGVGLFWDQVAGLEDAGAVVREVAVFEEIEAVNARHRALVAAEAAVAHHAWYEAYGDRYREGTRELVRDGRDTRVLALAEGRAGRVALREAVGEAMAERGVDVLVCPAAPGGAPAGLESTGDSTMNLPWTHAGVPVVTVPAGWASGGLPVGMQVVGSYGDDEGVLWWAEWIAGALDARA